MSLEQEARDNAEIAAAATQAPVEIGVLGRVGGDEAAVGEHDIGFEQIVDGQAIFAGQVTRAAAQCEAGYPGGGDDAGRHRQPVDMCRMVDITLRAAGANADGALARIDTDALHHAHVDHQPVVDAAETRSVVTPAADGDTQIVVASKFDRRHNVRGVHAARDQLRIFVDHSVVEAAHIIIVGVRSADDWTAHGRDKGFGGCVLHDFLPEVTVLFKS